MSASFFTHAQLLGLVWLGALAATAGADPVFMPAPSSLPALEDMAAAAGDFDGDGDMDLIISGQGAGEVPVTRLYRNVGGFGFEEVTVTPGLPQVQDGAVAWGDFDNDGDLDLAITGSLATWPAAGDLIARVYRNDGPNGGGGWIFTNLTIAGLPGSRHGCVAWGDLDGDYDLDLCVSGDESAFDTPAGQRQVHTRIIRIQNGLPELSGIEIYKNPNAQPSPTPLLARRAFWTDLNVDGHADLVLTEMRDPASMAVDSGRSHVYYGSEGWLVKESNGLSTDSALTNQGMLSSYDLQNATWVSPTAVPDPWAYPATMNAVGDWDGNGRDDLFIPNGNYGAVLHNDGVDDPFLEEALPGMIYRGLDDHPVEEQELFTIFNSVAADLMNYGEPQVLAYGFPLGAFNPDPPFDDVIDPPFPALLRGDGTGGLEYLNPSTDLNVEAVFRGALIAADFNGDHAVDVFQSGLDETLTWTTAIYANQRVPNAAPTPPTAVEVVAATPTHIALKFTGATDAETPAALLRYDFALRNVTTNRVYTRLKATSGGSRLLPGQETMLTRDTVALRMEPGTYIEDGTYRLRVQTVDAGGRGSALSTEFQFSVEASTPPGETPADMPYRESVLEAGDVDGDGDFDLVQAGIGESSLVTTLSTVVSRNAGVDSTTQAHRFLPSQVLPALDDAAAKFGDIDGDGDLDLALSGEGPDGPVANVYENVGNGAFLLHASFDGVRDGGLDWGDYDNDGDLDLAINGVRADGKPLTRIYRNNGGTWSIQTTSINHWIDQIENVGAGSISWVDYDGDGDLDLFQTGVAEFGSWPRFIERNVGQLYENKGQTRYGTTRGPHWLFIPVQTELPWMRNFSGGTRGMMRAVHNWLDINADGRPDLLVSGHRAHSNTSPFDYAHAEARYYLNNGPDPSVLGGWSFTESPNFMSLTEEGAQTLAPGDWDADGRPDVLLTGFYYGYPSGALLRIIHHDGLLWTRKTYLKPLVNMDPVNNPGPGEPAWVTGLAAFGRFVQNGQATGVVFNGVKGWRGGGLAPMTDYRAVRAVFEEVGGRTLAPSAPTGLAMSQGSGGVTFSWAPSTDDLTPQAALTYNLIVEQTDGTPGGLPGMSRPLTGERLVCRPGNVGQRTSWTLRNLPTGNWRWGVQAQDAGYEASGITWSAQDFATVGPPPILVNPPQPLSQWVVVSPQGSLTAANLHGLAAGRQARVAVGQQGRILFSQRGGPFFPTLSNTEEDLYGVHINFEGVMAVGANGTILHSTDGIVYTPRASNTTATLRAITRGTPGWVAAGEGVACTSVDGLNWIPRNLPTTVVNSVLFHTVIEDITYAEGRYVAVGYLHTAQKVLTSTDGATWTDVTPPGLQTGRVLSVAWGDGKFVAGGGTSSTYPWRSDILTSPDGVNWSIASSQNYQDQLRKISYSGTWWMAATGSGAMRSTNGLTWTNAPQPIYGEMSAVCSPAPGEFTLAGEHGLVRSTANAGASWVNDNGSDDDSGGISKLAIGNGSLAGISNYTPNLLTSQDEGMTWARTSIPGLFSGFYDIAYGNGRYVAVIAGNRIVSTDEGRTWTHAVDGIYAYFLTFGAGAGRFVRPDFYGNVHYSSDGVSWTQVSGVSPYPFWTATYGLGKYLISDGGGGLYSSYNGADWIQEVFVFPGASTSGPMTLSFARDRFFATRADGYCAYSTDGVNWTNFIVPAAYVGQAVWHQDRYLMTTGTAGTLVESLDGVNWAVRKVPAGFVITALASTGNGLIVAGNGPQVLLSPSYIATPPTGAVPPVVNHFQQVTNSNPPEFQLTITGQAGQQVIVEISDDLVTWSELYTFIMAATTETIVLSDPQFANHRFFRLR